MKTGSNFYAASWGYAASPFSAGLLEGYNTMDALAGLAFGITVITAAIVFGGNLIADLLYGVVDPKIRRRAAK